MQLPGQVSRFENLAPLQSIENKCNSEKGIQF